MPDSKTEIKKVVSQGLAGVIASQQSLSLVDGENSSLYYRGIPIAELVAHSHFEEIAYLLWYGKLPKQAELDSLTKELATNRRVVPEVLEIIKKFPKSAHPMGVLRSSFSVLGLFDPEANEINPEVSLRQAIRMTAQIPTLIAAFYRIAQGKDPIEPDSSLSHAANFLYMLDGKKPNAEMEKALDAYLILLADHGFNASTFAGRVTVSTQSDVYSAVTSAIGTLKGDLHGSANQRAMELISDIGEPENAEKHILDLFAAKEKVMGFGHRIYKKQDPRAQVFRKIAEDVCIKSGNQKWVEISNIVEKVVWDQKQIPCNVDFYSASVLYVLGFPVNFFTTVFAASRVVGWTAHIMDQQKNNRLIRPGSEYVGPRNQPYTPMENRS